MIPPSLQSNVKLEDTINHSMRAQTQNPNL
uniref:Uncharacterized protein n=1 Tax=Rhizophora mucronata TaxID=61149 RepID=A0A2P2PW05_RHIMU